MVVRSRSKLNELRRGCRSFCFSRWETKHPKSERTVAVVRPGGVCIANQRFQGDRRIVVGGKKHEPSSGTVKILLWRR